MAQDAPPMISTSLVTLVQWGPAILGVFFPIVGVLLSAWSFSFSEDGAVPDLYAQGYSDIPQQVLDHGARYRARWSASVLFKCGALMVIAGIFMGFADSHSLGLLSLPAFLAYALTLAVIFYLLKTTRELWLNRRENAFSWFYTKDLFFYY